MCGCQESVDIGEMKDDVLHKTASSNRNLIIKLTPATTPITHSALLIVREVSLEQSKRRCFLAFSLTAQAMSKSNFYLLVSLPTSITSTADHDEAFGALKARVSADSESTSRFAIPEFSVGTLDGLVRQADELAKLESQCETVVNKVGESLRSILEGDEEKIAQQKTVNDSETFSKTLASVVAKAFTEPVDQYLQHFNWNKVKYRADRPIATLIDVLQKVLHIPP